MKLEYISLLILSSTKRTFESLGRIIGKGGDTIRRRLVHPDRNLNLLVKIAQIVFKRDEELIVAIDDTLIRKMFSKAMRGTGFFFDTKLGRKIISFKLLCCTVTNGKITIPLSFDFLYDKDLLEEPMVSKNTLIEQMVKAVQKQLSDKRLIIVADGAFATTQFIKFCRENNLNAEFRMHSNRVVEYKGKRRCIRDIQTLQPRGRQMARTIEVLWHGMPLYITAQRRIDKHGQETIIYQVATYQAKPSKHVAVYKKRWGIEKMFRTTKQHLGLQECQSRNRDVQIRHVSAVLLAFALTQLEAKNRKFDTPEDAIRAFKLTNALSLQERLCRLVQIFDDGGVANA